MVVGCATKNCDFLRRQSSSSRSSGVGGPVQVWIRCPRSALCSKEFAEGVACTAAPVFWPDGKICMAVGVAGPSASSVTPEVAGMVRKTAHAISTTIAKSIAGMTDRPKVDGPGTSLL
jgi:hypothetical protein